MFILTVRPKGRQAPTGRRGRAGREIIVWERLEQRMADTVAALAKHPAAFPDVLVTSSRTGAGMPELRAAMVRLLDERRR